MITIKEMDYPTLIFNDPESESIALIEDFVSDLKGIEVLYVGNILESIAKWKQTKNVRDLVNARTYLQKLINYTEK